MHWPPSAGLEQDLEDQGGVRGNDGRCTPRAVSEFCRHQQPALLALQHALDALIPAADDLVHAEPELDDALVEARPARRQSPLVSDLHGLAWHGLLGAASSFQDLVLKAGRELPLQQRPPGRGVLGLLRSRSSRVGGTCRSPGRSSLFGILGGSRGLRGGLLAPRPLLRRLRERLLLSRCGRRWRRRLRCLGGRLGGRLFCSGFLLARLRPRRLRRPSLALALGLRAAPALQHANQQDVAAFA
mmetsp:Transcript_75540/g.233721  ORF Transcript_75540/g.233721 Transcript_75540/m.233721 type:complete len:243 (-) Transcript_75540:261-989(-)